MKIFACVALLVMGVVMLYDGKQTFMTLYFQEPISLENSFEIEAAYLQAVRQAMAPWPIPAGKLELRLEPGNRQALQVRFAKDALDAGQRQQLRALFESFEPAREEVRPTGRLLVDMRQARQVGLGVYDFGPAPAEVIALGEMSLPLHFSFPSQIDVQLRRNEQATAQKPQADMICEASARLNGALPFEVTEFDVSGADLRGEMKLRMPSGAELRAPAQLSFDEQRLLERLEMGDMRVRIQRPETIDRLVFEFGKIGTVRDQPYLFFIRSDPEAFAACRAIAYQSGRPFSFYLGEGLDRLLKVRFAPQG